MNNTPTPTPIASSTPQRFKNSLCVGRLENVGLNESTSDAKPIARRAIEFIDYTDYGPAVFVHLHRLPTLAEAKQGKVDFARLRRKGVKMIAHIEPDTPEAVKKLAIRYGFKYRYSNQSFEVWSC